MALFRKKKKRQRVFFALLSLPMSGIVVHCAAVVGQWLALLERISSGAEEANEGYGCVRRIEGAMPVVVREAAIGWPSVLLRLEGCCCFLFSAGG
ncbi:hypothetical protein E1A91_A08G103800v1 [Gossypium mustelinum]|uniref:Uncharacterized protein n=3 Tax=Gossypium TaxID=3633 RepID=A0A5D2Y6R8_GOSMU|nr:hypothetical protein E1A91_A08G103800v1 [Gossypium mustelinum]